MSEEPIAPARKRAAPWSGRRRVSDAKTSFISVRCTAEERATIDAAATQAGLSVGAYLRALAFGSPGPRAVRRPPIEREELARLLGLLGKLGSNVNQIARAVNMTRNLPSWSELAEIRHDIGLMRAALMKALGRGD
jgi:Mobilization protein NikA